MNDFLMELASWLEDQGIGVFDTESGRNIFVNTHPASPSNCVSLIGQPGPTIGEQKSIPSLHFPRFQAVIRNTSYTAGSDKAAAVRTALHGKNRIILPHWRIMRCHADAEVQPIGEDAQGRYEFSINFSAELNSEPA